MRRLVAFCSGSLFGVGLLLSGMTDTSKVQGWLDFFGNWDPTLAFVMGGAMIPMFIAWRFTEGRKPIYAEKFPSRPQSNIDRDLILDQYFLVWDGGWPVYAQDQQSLLWVLGEAKVPYLF